MAIKKVYDLSVDLKRTRIKANVPVLVQGDSTEFRLRLLENGKELTPEQISGVTSVELLSGYDAQTIIRTVGTMQGSEAVFSIGQGELFKTGQVKAMVRLADADDRISTLNFEYTVIPDLTANYVPGEQDVSIFQQYISDAQQKIDEMAATDVQQLSAQLAETVKKEEPGVISWAMAKQDFREQITGGNTAVVGVDSVLEESIVDGVVSPKKTTFIEQFPNLFDFNQVVEGYRPAGSFLVSHYNDLLVSETHNTSQVFEVNNSLDFITNIQNPLVMYYNTDGLRTGGVSPTAVNSQYPFSLPSGTKFFRIYYLREVHSNAQTFMVFEGSALPAEFVPFGSQLEKTILIEQSQIKDPAVTKAEITTINTKVAALESTVLSDVVNTTFKKNTAVILLDSISAQNTMNTDITKRTYAEGYFTWANILLGQRFKLLNNAGIGGNTTAQMLARLKADVLDYKPSYAFVLGGINDIIQSVNADTIIANLNEIYTRLLADGIIVLASKILPSTMITAGAFTANVNKVNQFIERFAFTHDNFILVNMAKYFTNPETGEPAANMTTDGTHPIKLGGFYLGKAIAEELNPLIPQHNDFGLSNAKKDTINPNPMMLGNTNGLATSYGLTNATNTTPTKVPRTDIAGEYQRLTVSDVGGTSYFGLSSSMGTGSVAEGDKYYAQCEVSMSDIEKYDKVKLYLHVTNDAGQIVASAEALYSQDTVQVAMPDWKGVLKTHEITVPTGGVKLLSKIEYNIKGILDVGRYEVKKVI